MRVVLYCFVLLFYIFSRSMVISKEKLNHENGDTHCWFAFIGGTDENLVWTVCKGQPYINMPPLLSNQLSPLSFILTGVLGVGSINFNSTPFELEKQRIINSRLINPKTIDTEEFVNVFISSITDSVKLQSPVSLELQMPVGSFFSDDCLVRYVNEYRPVLSVTKQYPKAKLRLLTLTKTLLSVANIILGESNEKENRIISLGVNTSIKDIEYVLGHDILPALYEEPITVKIWASLSIVEIYFNKDVQLKNGANVLSGAKL